MFNRMAVTVVPLMRLPRGKDFFTYSMPPELSEPQGGEYVRMPFRSRTITGVVWDATSTQEVDVRKLRPIISLGKRVITNGQRELIDHCCRTLGGSRSSLVKFWAELQRDTPLTLVEMKGSNLLPTITLRATPSEALVAEIAEYTLHAQPNGQHLLLVPTIEIGELLTQKLQHEIQTLSVVFLSSATPKPALRSILKTMEELPSPTIVIATRMGLYLPWTRLQSVWVIDEHHGAHRQLDSEPRIDNRDAAQWLAHYWGALLHLTSPGPSLRSFSNTSIFTNAWPTHTSSLAALVLWESRVRSSDEGIPWQAWIREQLENALSVFVLPTQSSEAKQTQWCVQCQKLLRCPDCSRALSIHPEAPTLWYCTWCRTSPTLLTCPGCGGTRFRPSSSSAKRIQRLLTDTFPEYTTQIITEDMMASGDSTRPPSISIVECKHLLTSIDRLRWSNSNKSLPPLLIWSFETVIPPHYDQQERQLQLLYQCADLLVSQRTPNIALKDAPKEFLSNGSFKFSASIEAQLTTILEQRKTFGYPPANHMILLDKHARIAHNASKTGEMLNIVRSTLNIPFDVLSNAPALSRRKKFSERRVVVLRLSRATNTQFENALTRMIAALPQEWSISVDPEILPPALPT